MSAYAIKMWQGDLLPWNVRPHVGIGGKEDKYECPEAKDLTKKGTYQSLQTAGSIMSKRTDTPHPHGKALSSQCTWNNSRMAPPCSKFFLGTRGWLSTYILCLQATETRVRTQENTLLMKTEVKQVQILLLMSLLSSGTVNTWRSLNWTFKNFPSIPDSQILPLQVKSSHHA